MTDDPPKLNARPIREAARRLREEADTLDRIADDVEAGRLIRYSLSELDQRLLERIRRKRVTAKALPDTAKKRASKDPATTPPRKPR